MKRSFKVIIASVLALTFIFLTSCDFFGGFPSVTTGAGGEVTTPGADTTPGGDITTTVGNMTTVTPDECTGHADADDNGLCDYCTTSLFVVLDFYVMNDLHGKFDDTTQNIGVDELTTYLFDRVENDEHTVFLSSGDMWQGSAESNITRGELITKWMNELGFEAMTLGNHEFDWGVEFIEKNAEVAQFPILAINIFDSETNEPVEFCQPSVMIERGGIDIGIIGAVGDVYSSISSDKVEGLYFKTGSELTALVKAEAERLRDAGAELIVYSIHDGYDDSYNYEKDISWAQLSSYYDVSLSDGYVDLVFEGHTHQKYMLRDSYGVYHMQNGGENKGISHVELSVNSVTGTVSVSQAEVVSSSTYGRYDDHPIVDTLLGEYGELIAEVNRVLGTNKTYLSSNAVCRKVAELYYQKGIEKWGARYDIVLGGGYLSTRSPYDLSAGEVKYADLMSILPFDNEIVLCTVRGAKLEDQFINNSKYTVYGSSIPSRIDRNATYYIIVDTYTAYYGWNELTVVESYGADIFARDLLADYIEAGGLE